jgi:hypothetical protein
MEHEASFNIPLYYNSKKRKLEENIVKELESVHC